MPRLARAPALACSRAFSMSPSSCRLPWVESGSATAATRSSRSARWASPSATMRFSQLWSACMSLTVLAQVVARTQLRSSPVSGSVMR